MGYSPLYPRRSMTQPGSELWTVGPPLIVQRANLSVLALDNRLFAIGGFSGKKFLNTLEWLDLEDMEWLNHAPRQDNTGKHKHQEGLGKRGNEAEYVKSSFDFEVPVKDNNVENGSVHKGSSNGEVKAKEGMDESPLPS